MAELSFTARGAVPAPRTLHLRVTRAGPFDLPSRNPLRTGAPPPSRDLTDAQVAAALHHAVVARRGPRQHGCTTAVLAGVGLTERARLPAQLDEARAAGLRRVVLHLPADELAGLAGHPLADRADDAAGLLATPADAGQLARAPIPVTGVLPLDDAGLKDLPERVRAAVDAELNRLVLSWPLHGDAPPIGAVRDALRAVLPTLRASGVAFGLKGVPACQLGGLDVPTWRTANRLWMDAEHLGGAAQLVVPERLSFLKLDGCRFCAADPRCDGVSAAVWRAGRADPLVPRPAEPSGDP